MFPLQRKANLQIKEPYNTLCFETIQPLSAPYWLANLVIDVYPLNNVKFWKIFEVRFVVT